MWRAQVHTDIQSRSARSPLLSRHLIFAAVLCIFAPAFAFAAPPVTSSPVQSVRLTSISVTPGSASIGVGSSQKFKAIATYSDKTRKDVTDTANWTSSHPKIATVSRGAADGKTPGTAVIRASLDGISGSANLNVMIVPTLVSIEVQPANATISVGSALQFEAFGTYDDGSRRAITQQVRWRSSDTSVAALSGHGLVIGKSVGNCSISATLERISGSSLLTVSR